MSNREDQCYVGKLLKALYDYKSEKLAGLVGFDTVCLQSAQVFFNRNKSIRGGNRVATPNTS